MNKFSDKNIALLKITAAMFIFGTIGIFVCHIGLPSGFLAFARGIMGSVFLLAITLFSKKKLSFASIKKNLILLIVSGVFIGINWILLFEAYRFTTVASATLCYYLSPVFVIIASPFVLREKMTIKKALCVFSALLGIVFVSGVIEEGVGDLKGLLLGVGAAVFYACVVLLNKHLKDISSYDMTVVQLAAAAITILPYTLLTEDISADVFDATAIVMLIIVGTVHTGLAYVLYFGSIKDLPAQTAAIFSYIDPVVAIILSALFLSEPLSPLGIVGAVLVLGSTLICELPSKKQSSAL